MLDFIKDKLSFNDIHTLEVVNKSTGSLIVKIFGMILGLIVSVILGRTLGAEGLGIIDLSNKIISITLVFAFLGLNRVIIKEVAISHSKGEDKTIQNILFTSYILNVAVSLVFTLILIFISEWLAINFFKIPELEYPLIIFSVAITPQIISRILSSALAGYKKIWQSNLVDSTLSTAFILILLGVLWLLNIKIDVNTVAIIYMVSRILVTVSIIIYWKNLNKSFFTSHKSKFIGQKLMVSGFPLLIVSAALLISTTADTLMLGWLSTADQIGMYNIAAKLALLTSFLLQITNSTIGPKIAVLFDDDKKFELEILLQRVSLALTIIGFLTLLFFVFFGELILSLWGEDFKQAYYILVVLTIGQFFNIASGPVGNLLIMTGYEKVMRNITVLTVGLNLVLNYELIQRYEAFGAAIATTITLVLNMGLCFYYVRKELNLKITKFI